MHNGDIVGILDNNLQLVVEYVYSSYGEVVSIKDAQGNDVSGNASHIANLNPYRYRSYRYDVETRLLLFTKPILRSTMG